MTDFADGGPVGVSAEQQSSDPVLSSEDEEAMRMGLASIASRPVNKLPPLPRGRTARNVLLAARRMFSNTTPDQVLAWIQQELLRGKPSWWRANKPWAVVVTAVAEDFDPADLPHVPTPEEIAADTAARLAESMRTTERLVRDGEEYRQRQARLCDHPEECNLCRGSGEILRPDKKSATCRCPAGIDRLSIRLNRDQTI